MSLLGMGGIGQNQYNRSTGVEQAKMRGQKPEGKGEVGKDAPLATMDEPMNAAPQRPNMDTYVPSVRTETTTEEDTSNLAENLGTMEEVGTEETDKPTQYNVDLDAVNKLKADYEMNQQKFFDSMISMIHGQAGSSLTAAGLWDKINLGDYEITPEMQAEAQEAISEDGYWGVEQTANRIVDMAKALVGGDPSKADDMMAAIEKGYEAAGAAWGGDLPEITNETKAAIDDLFAEWKGVSGE